MEAESGIDKRPLTTFAALADPTRRAILARLATGEASVMELAEPFDMSQPAISKHLKVLERVPPCLGVNASRLTSTGVFREIVAPERLVSTERMGMDGQWYPGEALNTHTFVEKNQHLFAYSITSGMKWRKRYLSSFRSFTSSAAAVSSRGARENRRERFRSAVWIPSTSAYDSSQR